MFYMTVVPAVFLSALMIVHLRGLQKHDKVLFRLCEVRRKMMRLLRESGEELSVEDYAAARALLNILGTTIHNYHETKQRLLDGRRFFQFLNVYSITVGEVESLTHDIRDPRVAELQMEFGKAIFHGFLLYTPLLRSELVVRFIVGALSLFARLGVSRMKKLAAALVTARDTAERQGHTFGYAQ
jgi:hypothetical protein